jgi:hypothetical protein
LPTLFSVGRANLDHIGRFGTQRGFAPRQEAAKQFVDSVGSQLIVDHGLGRTRQPTQRGSLSVDCMNGGLVCLPSCPEQSRRWTVAQEHHRVKIIGSFEEDLGQCMNAFVKPRQKVWSSRGSGLGVFGTMIGISGYVGCRPAMHHALVYDKRRNVPPRAARDCRGQTRQGSLIMEPFSSRTYRRQILIEREMRGSGTLLPHPPNLVRHVPPSSGGSLCRHRLIGQEADDDSRPPEGL